MKSADSEDPTELVLERWIIPETQEVDMCRSDNGSEAQTDRDEMDGNDARWRIEEVNFKAVVTAKMQAYLCESRMPLTSMFHVAPNTMNAIMLNPSFE